MALPFHHARREGLVALPHAYLRNTDSEGLLVEEDQVLLMVCPPPPHQSCASGWSTPCVFGSTNWTQ